MTPGATIVPVTKALPPIRGSGPRIGISRSAASTPGHRGHRQGWGTPNRGTRKQKGGYRYFFVAPTESTSELQAGPCFWLKPSVSHKAEGLRWDSSLSFSLPGEPDGCTTQPWICSASATALGGKHYPTVEQTAGCAWRRSRGNSGNTARLPATPEIPSRPPNCPPNLAEMLSFWSGVLPRPIIWPIQTYVLP